jgi:hypothetical protein
MRNQITLKSNAEDVQQLVVQLLGRGLKSKIGANGSFILRSDNIFDLHRRLTERVKSQNDSRLVDYYCTFRFSDDSEERLPSEQSFQSFRYMGNKRCQLAELNYSFLIKFSDRGYEKQQVTVEFEVFRPRRRRERPRELSDYFRPDRSVGPTGFASIAIEHTDHVWANDIRNIFSQFVAEHVRRNAFVGWVTDVTRNSSPLLEVIVSASAFLLLMGTYTDTGLQEKRQVGSELLAVSEPTILSISERLDFLVSSAGKGSEIPVFLFLVVFFTPFISLFLIRRAISLLWPESHIVLNDVHERLLEKDAREVWRRGFFYFGAAVATIALGVASTRINELMGILGW